MFLKMGIYNYSIYTYISLAAKHLKEKRKEKNKVLNSYRLYRSICPIDSSPPKKFHGEHTRWAPTIYLEMGL